MSGYEYEALDGTSSTPWHFKIDWPAYTDAVAYTVETKVYDTVANGSGLLFTTYTYIDSPTSNGSGGYTHSDPYGYTYGWTVKYSIRGRATTDHYPAIGSNLPCQSDYQTPPIIAEAF
jgi:hypothetical protein